MTRMQWLIYSLLFPLCCYAYAPGAEGVYIDGERVPEPLSCLVRGRVVIGMSDAGYQGKFGAFDRVSGKLKLSSGKATGDLHVEMNSWKSVLPKVDPRIRHFVFHTRRYPYAALHIRNIEGLAPNAIPVNSVGTGRLIGQFKILDQVRAVNIPVRIHRFGATAWGVEPVNLLQMSVGALGFADEREDLNQATNIYFGDIIQVSFRLEVEGI